MKKIAFFVEGQTEQLFVNRLVKEIIGENNLTIILKRLVGGGSAPKQQFVRNASLARKAQFHVLIYDCGSDARVKSEILDNLESLKKNNYECIVGLRDLYPLSIEELPNLEKGLRYLPYKYRHWHNPYDIVIAVQEVETWFLAETNHFAKVDSHITGAFIKRYLKFNPFEMNVMSRKHPSQDLNNIYQLVGKSYTKRYAQVEKLINRLDFHNLLHTVRHSMPSLNKLIRIIEDFKKE